MRCLRRKMEKQKPKRRNRLLYGVVAVVVIVAFLLSAISAYHQAPPLNETSTFAVRLNVSGRIVNLTQAEHPDCFILGAGSIQINTTCGYIMDQYYATLDEKANCTSEGCPVNGSNFPEVSKNG
jgi:hypothetical protein